MSARTTVAGWLTQNVGFPFNESELSPNVRAKIGQLAELRQQVEMKHYGVSQSPIGEEPMISFSSLLHVSCHDVFPVQGQSRIPIV